MNPLTIFKRGKVCYSDTRLIHINSIFCVINVDDIIHEFIEKNETFETIMDVASKILKIKHDKIVMYRYTDKKNEWLLHPILVKSVLRHIDSLISSKTMIAKEIYIGNTYIGINTIKHCTLTTIVENVGIPYIMNKNSDGRYLKQKFHCDGILNNNDMFNDDILISKCIQVITNQILITYLPQCLCDIIRSYF
jgi:hypothetical protein